MRSLNSIKNFSKWMVSSSSLKRKDLWKLPKKLLNEKPVHAVCARSSKTLCSMSCLCSLHGTTLKSARSEEHTSELQSRFDLVCRLLLENKNIDLSLNSKRL